MSLFRLDDSFGISFSLMSVADTCRASALPRSGESCELPLSYDWDRGEEDCGVSGTGDGDDSLKESFRARGFGIDGDLDSRLSFSSEAELMRRARSSSLVRRCEFAELVSVATLPGRSFFLSTNTDTLVLRGSFLLSRSASELGLLCLSSLRSSCACASVSRY